MTSQTKFEITRPNDGAHPISGIYDSVAPRGLALGAHPTDKTKFALADNDNFLGFLERDIISGGATLADRMFGRTSDTPVGFECPYAPGDDVTVRKAYEVEMEGSDYILLTGTGSISATTPVGETLAFLQGKLRVAQSGEVVNATLMAVLTDVITAGNLRIRVNVIN